jgi:nicotinamide-nucleotide amidase
MVRAFVLPRVARLLERPPLRVETFRTVGVGESQLAETLGGAAMGLRAFTVSWLPTAGGVDIVLTQIEGADAAAMDAEAQGLHARLEEALGTRYFERGERALAKVVGDLLVARGETMAAAESVTGGTVARLVTEHAGASACFLAGAVTYSNASKTAMLGVRAETVEQYGAVSEETCTEMAHGIRRVARATYGVATTGIAGPTGASAHKPVGLTFVGVAWEGGVQVKRVIYPGDRPAIRDRAAHGALWLLFDQMRRRS